MTPVRTKPEPVHHMDLIARLISETLFALEHANLDQLGRVVEESNHHASVVSVGKVARLKRLEVMANKIVRPYGIEGWNKYIHGFHGIFWLSDRKEVTENTVLAYHYATGELTNLLTGEELSPGAFRWYSEHRLIAL